jgi:hypothetical protein
MADSDDTDRCSPYLIPNDVWANDGQFSDIGCYPTTSFWPLIKALARRHKALGHALGSLRAELSDIGADRRQIGDRSP